MSVHVSDSESFANFAGDPTRYLERMRKSGEPMLLTLEGQTAVVVQDAASYQRFLERVDRLEAIAAIKAGVQDIAAGRTVPVRQAFEEMTRRLGLPPLPDE
jgi:PHD/YefM family antitoxin component YafN of YafNO toxin-antitoxin module